MTDLCACGVPTGQLPPGHARITGTDGTEHCGQIDPDNPPDFLTWRDLENLR